MDRMSSHIAPTQRPVRPYRVSPTTTTEDPKDPFDRQKCIPGWDQTKIEEQVAFVLGCGGLGCGVALCLARLGVKKIYLLDKDVVEPSNLNRQLLFSSHHVGQRKVEAAADGLKGHIIGNTEVETLHLDAVKEWATVVDVARKCTVIFNNIDVGEYFDFAALSLAKSLSIPYSAGSSYARTWIVEFYTGRKEDSSFTYDNADKKSDVIANLHPSRIQGHKDLSFLPKDINPNTRSIGSNCLVCGSAGIMTVNCWAQFLMGSTMPNYLKFDVAAFEPDDMLIWPAPEDPEFADDVKGSDELQLTLVDSGKSFNVPKGGNITIKLKSNRTTGYSWTLPRVNDAAVVVVNSNEYEAPDPTLIGGSGHMVMKLTAVGSGSATVVTDYKRPWEEEVGKQFCVTLNVP